MKLQLYCYIIFSIALIINFSLGDSLYAQDNQVTSQKNMEMISQIPREWHSLINRLTNDGLSSSDVNLAFLELNPIPSQAPMGRKVLELYSNKFMSEPQVKKAKKPAQKIYKNIVTTKNVIKCQDFLLLHKKSFDYIEQKYAVPSEIAVSLLFVETKLGTYLGNDAAFFTLASMAQSTKIGDINTWLPKLKGYKNHINWINNIMVKRSNWAYKELYALLKYSVDNNINPITIPSSMYGAIGICQFMPSNIAKFGADGNGDGKINLFVEADAIASLANYLSLNGWKQGISRKKQHKTLKTYNRIDIYANTILALNDLIILQNNMKES